MVHHLRRYTRFRTKIAASFVIMAFIPLLIFAVVSWNIFISEAKKTAETHTSITTVQASNLIDVYISTIEKLADYVTEVVRRNHILDNTKQWEYRRDEIQEMLNDLADSHPEIGGILIVNNEDKYISIGMTRISKDPFSKEMWYKQAENKNGQIVLISKAIGRNIATDEEYSVDDVFSVAKSVIGDDGETIGVILFDVKHTIIKDAINQVSEGDSEFVFITDKANDIVYAPVNDVVYRVDPSWLTVKEGNSINSKIRGQQYQIRYKSSKYTGWKAVGVFSIDHVMLGVNSLIVILIFCIVVTILFIVFITVGLSDSITKPLSNLQKLMLEAEKGNLEVRFNMKVDDEIGDLGHSFNTMIKRIDQLMKQVYKEQKSKRDAEIKSLQEQIKPHFLYNTLDTISWMARDYDANDIVKLVDALTNMFRIALSKGKDVINLKDEIKHVSNYLYIQKIRYGERLNYYIELDKELEDCKVPKLILQPLVENAIYHGIKKKRSIGCIKVIIKKDVKDDKAILIVEDDGAGMTSEKCMQLTELLKNRINQKEMGFGIYYISQRMRISYGDNYDIKIESEQDIGTRVIIKIPIKYSLL